MQVQHNGIPMLVALPVPTSSALHFALNKSDGPCWFSAL